MADFEHFFTYLSTFIHIYSLLLKNTISFAHFTHMVCLLLNFLSSFLVFIFLPFYKAVSFFFFLNFLLSEICYPFSLWPCRSFPAWPHLVYFAFTLGSPHTKQRNKEAAAHASVPPVRDLLPVSVLVYLELTFECGSWTLEALACHCQLTLH